MEFFADGPNASAFAAAIQDSSRLIIPSICLAEVFKSLLRQRGENDALQGVAFMQQGAVVDLDGSLALAAASLGGEHGLPLADSVVYATAERVAGVIWTQDAHFEGLPLVRYFPKLKLR
jgi:predicted nucleic acid-binding protein